MYINVMFVYINVVLYNQCYIKGVYISFVRCKSSFKCHKSMLSVIHLFCNVASRSDIISFVWESGVHPSVTVVIMFDKTKTCSIKLKKVRIHPWPSWTGSGNDFCEQEVISSYRPSYLAIKDLPAVLVLSCRMVDAGNYNSRSVQDFVRSVLNVVTSLQSNAENADRSRE